VKALDDDEKVTPVEPIHGLRSQPLRPFGAEERTPNRGLPPKKRQQPEKAPEGGLPCTITPDKVDCKI